jgi:hypothetical protein
MMGWLSKCLVAVIPVLVFALLMVRPPGLHTPLICLKQASWLLRVRLLLQQVLVMAERIPFHLGLQSVTP